MTNRPIVGEAPVEDGLAPLDSLEIMAGRLSMSSTEWLEEALAFLEEKSQLLLQGPRGAGKTFIARELARYLAGYPSRVVTVQFHPGTSYEDFVQGLRAEPTTPPRLSVVDGRLMRVSRMAAENPDQSFVLLIDEINPRERPGGVRGACTPSRVPRRAACDLAKAQNAHPSKSVGGHRRSLQDGLVNTTSGR